VGPFASSLRWLSRALVLFAAALVFVASAAGDVGHDKASIDAKLSQLRGKIAAAEVREGHLKREISSVTSQIRSLEGRVETVSGQLAALRSDLALQQRRLDALAELFKVQTERYSFLRKEYAAALERLNARLVEIYEQGQPSTTELILSSKNLTQLLDQLAYFNAIAKQDKRIVADVGQAKAEVRAQRNRTRHALDRLLAATRTARVREHQVALARDQLLLSQHKLSGARGAKVRALAATQDSRREFVSEADALARQSAQLAARIQSAQGGGNAYAGPSSSGFIWPVAGPVTSPFGMRWGRMHEGIDIAVPYGTAIRAAAAGRVIYCGWEGGYGNLVVIDHGGGLATAYGHQSSIAASCGSDVSQGQVIGYVGSTGHSTGPHLHFEVRVNGAPVDPLGYL
jgi:murein DD-endopeptidase MepM/ murein hydrolase activator NlpD